MTKLFICVHCGREAGDPKGGEASVGLAKLCHPSVDGRPDCYHMVSVYSHPLEDCGRCGQEPYQPMTSTELHDAMLDSLKRMEQMIRDAMP